MNMNPMNNPVNMLKAFICKGMNPQQIVMDMIKGNSNPMINHVLDMAIKGDNESIESFARNIFKEKGKDFDKEFSNFMKNIR